MASPAPRVDSAERQVNHGGRRHRPATSEGGTPAMEYEIRLFEPRGRRPLVFTRVPSAASAASLARRWQAARPECRVRVVETRTPRPYALVAE